MRAARAVAGALAAILVLALAGSAEISVVATTSIVGDVVRVVGGDRVEVVVLIPPGTDPHAFVPTPRDLVLLARADVVFMIGAGLEEGLIQFLESPELRDKVVDLSVGLPLRTLEDDDHDHGHGHGHGHDHGGSDPHVWFDPLFVAGWTLTIERTLSALDPNGAEAFAARAGAYWLELAELDRWIHAQVAGIPAERRLLVTDHKVLGYFAARYGFRVVGAIIPGFSTLAEPSAREMAALVDQIRLLGVPAVFVPPGFNPAVTSQLARDTGVRIVPLFLESLSAPDGPAPTYLELMRENVRRIVDALRG